MSSSLVSVVELDSASFSWRSFSPTVFERHSSPAARRQFLESLVESAPATERAAFFQDLGFRPRPNTKAPAKLVDQLLRSAASVAKIPEALSKRLTAQATPTRGTSGTSSEDQRAILGTIIEEYLRKRQLEDAESPSPAKRPATNSSALPTGMPSPPAAPIRPPSSVPAPSDSALVVVPPRTSAVSAPGGVLAGAVRPPAPVEEEESEAAVDAHDLSHAEAYRRSVDRIGVEHLRLGGLKAFESWKRIAGVDPALLNRLPPAISDVIEDVRDDLALTMMAYSEAERQPALAAYAMREVAPLREAGMDVLRRRNPGKHARKMLGDLDMAGCNPAAWNFSQLTPSAPSTAHAVAPPVAITATPRAASTPVRLVSKPGEVSRRFGKKIVCFNCDSDQHLAGNCPQPRDPQRSKEKREAFVASTARSA
jgi:hypothetical protein